MNREPGAATVSYPAGLAGNAFIRGFLLLVLLLVLLPRAESADRVPVSGKVMFGDTPLCAMVLANGQFTFSCDGSGSYALNIPLDTNGQFKLQVYADGFAPTIQVFDEFRAINDVRMARAAECQ